MTKGKWQRDSLVPTHVILLGNRRPDKDYNLTYRFRTLANVPGVAKFIDGDGRIAPPLRTAEEGCWLFILSTRGEGFVPLLSPQSTFPVVMRGLCAGHETVSFTPVCSLQRHEEDNPLLSSWDCRGLAVSISVSEEIFRG